MWFLVILGILILLAVLLSRIRLGVRLTWEPGSLTAEASIGPFRIRLYPPAQRKKNTTQSPAPKEAAQPQQKKHAAFPKPTAEDLRLALETLLPLLRRALDRTRRGHSRHPPEICVTVGGEEDPCGRRPALRLAPYDGLDHHAGYGAAGAHPEPPSTLGSILTRIPPYPAGRSGFS